MKKSISMIVLLGFIAFNCSDPVENQNQPINDLVPKEQIDDLIVKSIEETGNFSWGDVSDNIVWSALMHSDNMVTVGYKPFNERDISSRLSGVNLKDREWIEARDGVLNQVVKTESKKMEMTKEDIHFFSHDVLPYVEMKVSEKETITWLRKMKSVRYVEPLSYEVDLSRFNRSRDNGRTADAGCGNAPESSLATLDFATISPNAKVPWNYQHMRIQDAWNHSTGRGITVGLIDTGVSPDQPKLNGEFNSGESTGRFIQKFGTYVSSWWPWDAPDGPDDKCGHGTAMAGVISAPRSNTGSAVGVAYNCNMVVYRGTGDVLINGGSEKTGVSNALIAMGNRSDVKVISMSIGDIFSSSKVSDAIKYAYGKGKLIFCAAGTSTNFTNWVGVIFPAWMDETVAVTGIKEGSGYNRCDICHSGNKVDFTIVMERSSGNHPLTLAMSGNQPSMVGGSSVATATAAGIAALIWARHPTWTRQQVLDKMKQSSSNYPSRNSEYGWGTPDAFKAVQ